MVSDMVEGRSCVFRDGLYRAEQGIAEPSPGLRPGSYSIGCPSVTDTTAPVR